MGDKMFLRKNLVEYKQHRHVPQPENDNLLEIITQKQPHTKTGGAVLYSHLWVRIGAIGAYVTLQEYKNRKQKKFSPHVQGHSVPFHVKGLHQAVRHLCTTGAYQ